MAIANSVTHILEIPQMIYFQYNPTLFSLEFRLSVGLYHGLHNGLYKLQIAAQTVIILSRLPNIDIGSSFFMRRNVFNLRMACST